MTTRRRSTAAVMLAAALTFVLCPHLATSAADPPAADPPAAAEKVHVVKPADLTLTVRRDGRIDSAARLKVRFAPEAWGGAPKILEVGSRGGPISKGQMILRLDPEELEKSLRSARESLADAQRSLELTRQERAIQAESQQVVLERAEWTRLAAVHAKEIFDKTESANMLKSAQLNVEQQENNVLNQQQELDQLESMYKDTHLASETKDIVLERARRSLRFAQEYLAMGRDNLATTKEYRHPDRARDVEQQLKWTSIDLEHARIELQLNQRKSQAALEHAERDVRDATERLEKLERDRTLIQITAPADGLLTAIDLQPGDKVSGGQVIAELLNPQQLIVKFNAAEEDLRVLSPQRDVTLLLPSFGEDSLLGSVSEIASIGTPGDGGTNFPCVVTIRSASEHLRVGMRCTASTNKTLTKVLAVPREVLKTREGQSYCMVRRGGATHEVPVTLGASNSSMVQVVSGLTEGDEVVLPAPPATEDEKKAEKATK